MPLGFPIKIKKGWNMLNCKLGSWLMKYLGILVSNSRLGVAAFLGIKEKMRKRLDPWKGKHMSSGGKLILTNSCLTSLPIYTMGFYLLPKRSHDSFDPSEADSSGKKLRKNTSTIWLDGK
jgi:hypothetical protein